jgi:hypothetical protein
LQPHCLHHHFFRDEMTIVENMAIRAINPSSAIRPTFTQTLRRLTGSASAALGGINPTDPTSASRRDGGGQMARSSAATPSDSVTANASVVSELVTNHAGGAVTTITTYLDGHSTARTAFARFTSTGEMDTNHSGTGQLVNLLV